MPVLAPEDEAMVDEPYFGEDEYPAETDNLDNDTISQSSTEGSESEVAHESEVASDDVEASAEAEPEGEGEQTVEQEGPSQRKIQYLEDQVKYLMQQKVGPAPDIQKLQDEVSKPFRFELPQNLENVEVSEEFRQIAKDDPAHIQVMGEMMNLLLNQYNSHSEKTAQANQTIQAHQQEQYAAIERELGKAGIDPKFADSPECTKMLEDPNYFQKAQSYYNLYGMSSPRFYVNLHADFQEWASANNVALAKGKNQKAATRSASAPKKPIGAGSAPTGKKSGDDDFFAKVATYQKRS
jgi:hypothetical protein